MYNQSIIWALRPRNIYFQSVFASNWCFSVKPKANTFEFWTKIWNFLKPIKTYIWDHYVNISRIWPLRLRNTEFWSVFVANYRCLVKPKANPFVFWAKICFLKPIKLTYGITMYNWSGIWSLWPRNTEFQSIFTANSCFLVKPNANTFGFWAKIWSF
jgi:hypothetical protein